MAHVQRGERKRKESGEGKGEGEQEGGEMVGCSVFDCQADTHVQLLLGIFTKKK